MYRNTTYLRLWGVKGNTKNKSNVYFSEQEKRLKKVPCIYSEGKKEFIQAECGNISQQHCLERSTFLIKRMLRGLYTFAASLSSTLRTLSVCILLLSQLLRLLLLLLMRPWQPFSSPITNLIHSSFRWGELRTESERDCPKDYYEKEKKKRRERKGTRKRTNACRPIASLARCLTFSHFPSGNNYYVCTNTRIYYYANLRTSRRTLSQF